MVFIIRALSIIQFIIFPLKVDKRLKGMVKMKVIVMEITGMDTKRVYRVNII